MGTISSLWRRKSQKCLGMFGAPGTSHLPVSPRTPKSRYPFPFRFPLTLYMLHVQ
jgi:hypothetical protein